MDILDKIVAHKKKELAEQKKKVSLNMMAKSAEDYLLSVNRKIISMRDCLRESKSGIISEFKRRSPSKGWIREDGKADEIPLSYSENGASAISILTDKEFFGGSTDYLMVARSIINHTPLLRKEFIIDEYQVFESLLIGADAILLIASDLSLSECRHLSALAKDLGLEVLLEIHDENELDYVGDNIDMVGVNNRHLGTFHTDVMNSMRIAPLLPSDYVLVSESGISSATTVKELRSAGFRGFLIGETFMRSADPGKSLRKFIQEIEN